MICYISEGQLIIIFCMHTYAYTHIPKNLPTNQLIKQTKNTTRKKIKHQLKRTQARQDANTEKLWQQKLGTPEDHQGLWLLIL